ncbi:hypothetical protein [uncultured Roseobacter sp.]|uniref:hypothetical protein n=1 Tax=uncultured Roseobacter sp. TaxID=114847 RepID=UPI002615F508|nr:hypothetical protein [uncultured Roseobacter sp.]
MCEIILSLSKCMLPGSIKREGIRANIVSEVVGADPFDVERVEKILWVYGLVPLRLCQADRTDTDD